MINMIEINSGNKIREAIEYNGIIIIIALLSHQPLFSLLDERMFCECIRSVVIYFRDYIAEPKFCIAFSKA